jgi:hypothetical protein
VITVADVADENRRNVDLTLNMPPISERISNLQKEKDKDNIDRNLLDISREASVKDLTERLQVKRKIAFGICNVLIHGFTLSGHFSTGQSHFSESHVAYRREIQPAGRFEWNYF